MSAIEYAKLYGLAFVSRKRSHGRLSYRFTDLVTGNTLLVQNLSRLAAAVVANRETGFADWAKQVALNQAVKLSERFHGQVPRFEREIDIDWPDSLTSLGVCARVDYIADKWGDGLVRYWHEFEGPVMLLADPDLQKNGYQVLIIYGKFKIESDGITG